MASGCFCFCDKLMLPVLFISAYLGVLGSKRLSDVLLLRLLILQLDS